MTTSSPTDDAVRPTRVEIPLAAVDDLRHRLETTRWFDAIDGSGWDYGTDHAYLRELCAHWARDFDWYAVQARINAFEQVETIVDGQRVHAIHQRSTDPDAIPLLLVHGWPGSVLEFLDVIGPLTEPQAHGAPHAPAFHAVVPSIPGYGFSGPTSERGWNVRRISAAFDTLMARLGYERYAVAGGDWGAIIATDLARSDRAGSVISMHLTMPLGLPPAADEAEELTDDEQQGVRDWERHLARGTVNHVATNSLRPHTMALAMNDSPAGLASWLIDMCRSFTVGEGDVERALTREQLLANVSVYWFTGTIASACRLYWEWAAQKAADPHPPYVTVPTSVAIFPSDVRRVPRSWAERLYDIVDWREMPEGGHFGSWEQPELFVAAVREGLVIDRRP
jgi:pimeloyl-ACP methyl ester carboxylesterase